MDTKKKHLITNILIASAMSFAVVGCGVAYLYNEYQKPQVSKAYSYDDENYQITLTAYELNNYTFTNLQTYINTFSSDIIIGSCSYTTYSNINLKVQYITSSSPYYCRLKLEFSNPFPMGYFNNLNSGLFLLDNYGNSPFSDSLILTINSSYYDDFKSAIELDIQVNASNDYTNDTFLQDIISLLVGGISATATGIGTGLNTLVSDIAIQNGAMSSFVSIVLIFGAIALAFALSRWVVNLISSLGQRNR